MWAVRPHAMEVPKQMNSWKTTVLAFALAAGLALAFGCGKEEAVQSGGKGPGDKAAETPPDPGKPGAGAELMEPQN